MDSRRRRRVWWLLQECDAAILNRSFFCRVVDAISSAVLAEPAELAFQSLVAERRRVGLDVCANALDPIARKFDRSARLPCILKGVVPPNAE